MDVAELKARFAEIAASLSQSVGEDATALALLNSQNLLISTLLEMFATLSEQNKAQQEQNEKLNSTIVELQETIKELRRQIGKNSNNSSKPPSSDGFKKQPRSLRKKSGNKVGAQHGHAGKNLSIPHAPDEVREHLPEKCNTCPHLRECVTSGQVFECGGSRYVIEAELSTRVIEHQIMRAVDCRCGESSLSGEFPQGVKAHVQYGDSVTVLCGLLSTYGAVSIKRIHVLLSGCLGVSISTGTISARVERCAKQVGGTMDKVFELLTRQGVIHFDETGLRVGGKLHWVHNSSTEDYTYQSVNSKRGMDGIEDNGVLPKLEQAIAVHDCWSSYWKYDKVEHAVCCAHLLRELESVKENEPNQQWAPQFTELLLEMKKAKETA